MLNTTRQVLYRAAESRWLAAAVLENDRLTRVARRAADRYLGGETLQEAIAAVRMLHAQGLLARIDYLGEAVTNPILVERTIEEYRRLNAELSRLDQPVNVWADLSNLGLDISQVDLFLRIRGLSAPSVGLCACRCRRGSPAPAEAHPRHRRRRE
jgi:proline dehydrogenase